MQRSFSIPAELDRALRAANIHKTFEALAPSCKREHIRYVAEAKQETTRERRAKKVISMLGAGLR